MSRQEKGIYPTLILKYYFLSTLFFMKTVINYLSHLSITLSDEKHEMLNEIQTKKIFLMVVEDYLRKEITEKELSMIISSLLYTYNNRTIVDTKYDSSLSRLLDDASELDYYIQTDKPNAKKIIEVLKEYYNRNR